MFTIPLKVATLPGFHVNSDKPKGEYLIPFSLSWSSGPLEPERVTYPQAQTMKVGADTLAVFTGTFTITTQFKARPEAGSGPATLTGKIHYQACNSQMCFRPATLEVRVPVTIQ